MVVSPLFLCGPVMDWRPVQGEPLLWPDDRWDRLQPPRNLTDGLSGYRRWMDFKCEDTLIQIKCLPSSGNEQKQDLMLMWDSLACFIQGGGGLKPAQTERSKQDRRGELTSYYLLITTMKLTLHRSESAAVSVVVTL